MACHAVKLALSAWGYEKRSTDLTTASGKRRSGFASLTPEQRKAVSTIGGKKLQERNRAMRERLAQLEAQQAQQQQQDQGTDTLAQAA
jgi:hypothetical protein